jgi:DmsE family decaheme c-type cytochrome
MQRSEPLNEMGSWTQRIVPVLRTCLIFVLGAIVFCVIAIAAPGPEGKGSGQAANPAPPAGFAGSNTCATCHDEEAKNFADNPHVRMAQMHGKNGITCENCHGPGKAHAESADPSKIFNPAKGTTKQVDAMCLGCHQGQHSNFERSGHAEANVSCVSCHSIHDGKDPEQLLKAAQPVLCFQCHIDTKPNFSMPFHHKVEEGLIQCTDCHDPHGTFQHKGLKLVSQQDMVCMKCHAETAGPFVYEHPVVKTEGCVACHSPHGSPNPRMLNRANVNTICLQCHSPSMNFTTSEPIGPVHNQALQYQSCTICHTDIHGSNVSDVFFNTK